jgi:hypothetical protein
MLLAASGLAEGRTAEVATAFAYRARRNLRRSSSAGERRDLGHLAAPPRLVTEIPCAGQAGSMAARRAGPVGERLGGLPGRRSDWRARLEELTPQRLRFLSSRRPHLIARGLDRLGLKRRLRKAH